MSKKVFLGAFVFLLSLNSGTEAQQPNRIPRIGILALSPGPTVSTVGFLQGLRDLGYAEGKNIIIESRYAAGNQDRLTDLAAELLRLKVDIIVSGTTEAFPTVRRLNATIPMVMWGVSDPIGTGIVDNLAHPGNTTGMSSYATEVAGKRLEILNEVIPRLTRVAVLAYQNHPPTALLFKETEVAAKLLKIRLQTLEIDPHGLEGAFDAMARERAGALIVQQAALFDASFQKRVADLAMKQRLPTIHESNEFVGLGGLMSYGPLRFELGRHAAIYVDKILKGAKPSDLPVEQPTKFELVISLKTANQIGLSIPPNVLARADKVIK